MSRIDTGEEPIGIEDDLPDAHLFRIEAAYSDLAEIAQFLEKGQAPKGMSDKNKKDIGDESCTLHYSKWISLQT